MTASALCDRILARARLADTFVTVPQAHQLADYYELLEHWNQKINLSSLVFEGFPDATLDRLLIEPIAIKGLIGNIDEEWVDVGSGGGSPAIPLNIVCPAWKLLMVEAKSRKSAFLREAARKLHLPRASVWTGRVEVLPEAHGIGKIELVTVRAVRLGKPLLAAVSSLLRPGGRLAIFGTSGPPSVGAFPFSLIESTKLPPVTGENAVHWFARLHS